MKAYEYLDHTGDLGLRVQGGSLQELFTNAAHGLFETIAVLDTIDSVAQVKVCIEAESLADLMVVWLDELIFAHEVEGIFFKQVDILELSEMQLSAVAYGEQVDFTKHVVYTEVKSATYHQLIVRQTSDGAWMAQVIFDL